MIKKTLGGERLGSGNKNVIDLHGYERSTHNLSYIWRSTMSAGTLVPFMSQVALPGDTFDIDLNCEIMTHPAKGPLFGSFKVQLDTFLCPIRLYHSQLHNNALGIGLDMEQIKLPVMQFGVIQQTSAGPDPNSSQINPSCLLAYLGLRGWGINKASQTKNRGVNAVPVLAYWDIYKNYYSAKSEEIGAVIHTPKTTNVTTVTKVEISVNGVYTTVPQAGSGTVNAAAIQGSMIRITYSGAPPDMSQILLYGAPTGYNTAANWAATAYTHNPTAFTFEAPFRWTYYGNTNFRYWKYQDFQTATTDEPKVVTFPLKNLDDMRSAILAHNVPGGAFDINATPRQPYTWLLEKVNNIPTALSSQEGLGIKTYQSDLFNNWMDTDWITGPTGINAITAIDTTSGSFNVDTLILSKKVYELLARIAVSGGTYDDWLDAVYAHDRVKRAETPMYMGGLIRELVFQEVVSNAKSDDQVLGALGGQGIMAQKHKGGKIVIKVDEPSYIIGIVSLTPRIDYSQGNNWDIALNSINDLHKPHLDEIGFQDLICEQLAWWTTENVSNVWTKKSAGKQPAWLNYMTNVNKTYGNFALENEMFMTLNRKYEMDWATTAIADLTTYIDPVKYNSIFADEALDAQNFWTQIGVGITARRKMSAKVMPNL